MSHKFYKGNVAADDITSGTVAAARLPSLDGITAAAGNVDANSNKIINLANPSADGDAAPKKWIEDNFAASGDLSSYLTTSDAASTYLTQSSASSTYATITSLNNAIEGLDPKQLCEAATTANLSAFSFSAGTLTESSASGALTIDGVTLANDDRVLVKNQSSDAQNGIYVCANIDGSSAVTLTRASDSDSATGLSDAYVFIKDGTANAGKGFVQTASISTINSDTVTFTQFTSAASSLTQEQVEDFAGALVATGGTKTGITVTYDDANGDMDFVVSDLTVAGDSGSTGMTPGDTLTVAGGGDVTTAMSGDTLTISASKRTQEEVEDFAAGLITGATHTGLSVSYDDANGQLAFTTDLTTSNIGTYAVTSGNISSYAVTSVVSADADLLTATNAGFGQYSLDLPDFKKVTVEEVSSSVFIDAAHTITRANAKQLYVFTITDDRTLTLPRVSTTSQYFPVGGQIQVKLLSATSGKSLTVSRYSTDKIDGTAANVSLDTDGEALTFTAVAASGDSTSVWVIS